VSVSVAGLEGQSIRQGDYQAAVSSALNAFRRKGVLLAEERQNPARAFRAFSDVAKRVNFLLWFADREASWRTSARLLVPRRTAARRNFFPKQKC
jgi:hypothetical protein